MRGSLFVLTEGAPTRELKTVRASLRFVGYLLVVGWINQVNAGQYLGDLTWPEAEQAFATTRIVVLPFAAGAKEHGPHLPMNTDQAVMDYLLEAAVQQSEVLIAPAILHGWFPAFRDFPGTEVAQVSVFQNYVHAVAQSLVKSGAQRLVFLNLGITRATGLPLATVARDIRVENNIPTLLVSWDDLETEEVMEFTEQTRGGHADEIETSIMLALDAKRVQMDKAIRDYRKAPRPLIGYAPGKFERSESGVFGDPTLASVTKGERALAIMRAQWLEALRLFATKDTEGAVRKQ